MKIFSTAWAEVFVKNANPLIAEEIHLLHEDIANFEKQDEINLDGLLKKIYDGVLMIQNKFKEENRESDFLSLLGNFFDKLGHAATSIEDYIFINSLKDTPVNLPLIKICLEKNRYLLGITKPQLGGAYPIVYAAERNNVDLFNLLLKFAIDPTHVVKMRSKIFQIICRADNLDLLELFIKYLRENNETENFIKSTLIVSSDEENSRNLSALETSYTMGSQKIFAFLLNTLNIDPIYLNLVHYTSADYRTPWATVMEKFLYSQVTWPNEPKKELQDANNYAEILNMASEHITLDNWSIMWRVIIDKYFNFRDIREPSFSEAEKVNIVAFKNTLENIGKQSHPNCWIPMWEIAIDELVREELRPEEFSLLGSPVKELFFFIQDGTKGNKIHPENWNSFAKILVERFYSVLKSRDVNEAIISAYQKIFDISSSCIISKTWANQEGILEKVADINDSYPGLISWVAPSPEIQQEKKMDVSKSGGPSASQSAQSAARAEGRPEEPQPPKQTHSYQY